ncbi:MAG: hypothetical protein H6841_05310 [Planctomycetes bacterium]|nr:hypothetical protein [Planctomycetota bacterium]
MRMRIAFVASGFVALVAVTLVIVANYDNGTGVQSGNDTAPDPPAQFDASHPLLDAVAPPTDISPLADDGHKPDEHPLVSRLRSVTEFSDRGDWQAAREMALELRVEVGEDPESLVPIVRENLNRVIDEFLENQAEVTAKPAIAGSSFAGSDQRIRIAIRRVAFMALTLPTEYQLAMLRDALEAWKLPLREPQATRWRKANGVELSLLAARAVEGSKEEVLAAGFAYVLQVHWDTQELYQESLFSVAAALLASQAESHLADPIISVMLKCLRIPRRSLSSSARTELDETCHAWLDAPFYSSRLKEQLRLMLNDDLSSEAEILAALRKVKTHTQATSLIRKWLDNDPLVQGDFSALLDALIEALGSGPNAHRGLQNALFNSKQSESRTGVQALFQALSGLEDPTPAKCALCLEAFGEIALAYQIAQRDWNATFAFSPDPNTTRTLLAHWMKQAVGPHEEKRRAELSSNSSYMAVTILNSELPLKERFQLLVEFLGRSEAAGPMAQSLILQRICWIDVNDLILHQQEVLAALRAVLKAAYTRDTTSEGIRSDARASMILVVRSEYLLRLLAYPAVDKDIPDQLLVRLEEIGDQQDETYRPLADESFLALKEAGYFD